MTLGARMASVYASAMFVALLIFAAVAVFAIDTSLRSSIDGRLNAEANASASVLDISHGEIRVDAGDQRQFASILASGADAAVFSPDGALEMTTAAHIPAPILQLPRANRGFYYAGSGDAAVRALVEPIVHDRAVAGTIVVWRSTDWIEQTDWEAGIAFAVSALVIALIALFAGSAVTRRALHEAFERQQRFTADASHELRAPLAVIRAEADLALRKERAVNDYRAAFETVAQEADRMEAIIGDLLLAARVRFGKVKLRSVDVAAALSAAAQRLRSAAEAKGVTLHVRTSHGLAIAAEPQGLERILLAVLHNAIKYAPPSGNVWLESHADAGMADVTIRDDGPGFSREALEHALDRFWREDTARPHDGTGLGLAIARSIAEAMGGAIVLENTAAGALVRVRFPEA